MNDEEKRRRLYEAVHEEFVGPVDPDAAQVLGQWDNPMRKYCAGVLFPAGSLLDEIGESHEEPPEAFFEDDEAFLAEGLGGSGSRSAEADDDEPIALSNASNQAAMSVTVVLGEGKRVELSVKAASYERVAREPTEKDRDTYKFVRRPLAWESGTIVLGGGTARMEIPGTTLVVLAVPRYACEGGRAVTLAVENTSKSSQPCYSDCYFQVRLEARAADGFGPLPKASVMLDSEDRSKALIYRNVRNYAIGHGCAADWGGEGDAVTWVRTEVMPVAQTTPVSSSHPSMEGVPLDMFALADRKGWPGARKTLEALCDRYGEWIEDASVRAAGLPEEHAPAAAQNLGECRRCLARMRSGLSTLDADIVARDAFQMANAAMLDQYLHYSVVSGENTEIGEPRPGIRFWRPFQLAFILMNIDSTVDAGSADRGLLDLIWFPTGGGKTEAYLGLTAFTLILERLRGVDPAGSTVVMRYTLRLLTSQQFQRASSLICALESMRRRDPERLGPKPFSIGLWVGLGSTPNTWKDALEALSELGSARNEQDKVTKNRFPVPSCPWCGAKMSAGEGYRKVRVDGGYGVAFYCPDERCEFHYEQGKPSLPVQVVDEGIYAAPPSLLVGTVDKFATVPFREEAYGLFGFKAGAHAHAPRLVIQDELHLISGPLGSVTGHYETLMAELCRDDSGTRPKIVASTATVSNARQQCNQLFACGEECVAQFPPSGIDYDDSFFSLEDKGASGRMYVGVFAPNCQSFATASIRLYSTLLWEPTLWDVDDSVRDPYWTCVGYYGTTRELGQAATWASSDIPERLSEKRKKDPQGRKRALRNPIELTGRIDAAEVTANLKRLETRLPDRGTVDLCLATNMISVGLDVQRLGLMVVAGQPKSTAEYIQATSRVGRGGGSHGVVFVLYGMQRPRDRSHYENFRHFHESFYQGVEPTSLTSFCEQVQDRALPGTLIGIYRSRPGAGFKSPDGDAIAYARDVVLERVGRVDPDEVASVRRRVDEYEEKWERYTYDRWASLTPHPDVERDDAKTPLMRLRGGEDIWEGRAFEVQASMRSVGAECSLHIIQDYGEEG